MAKGVLYCMTTVVPGLIKIGKTTVDNFESRMYGLERNGYSNVVGLKRHFAIEVEDYDEKETLLDEIFSKSRVPNTELFALDIDLVVQLLSSFDGRKIYPEEETKETIFQKATEERNEKEMAKLPDGRYYLEEYKKKYGTIKATMRVQNGTYIVEKGSMCISSKALNVPDSRLNAVIENNVLQEDIECTSPSTALAVVFGSMRNGWLHWKTKDGELIDIYRSDEFNNGEKIIKNNVKENLLKIPDGKYYLSEMIKGFGKVEAVMRVESNSFIVEKGCICAPMPNGWTPKARRIAIIKDDILQEDVKCNSPSTATCIPMGKPHNGWTYWKDKDGQLLDTYRNGK